MSKNDKKNKQSGSSNMDQLKSEDILQAVVLGDSFDRKFAPITLEKPRVNSKQFKLKFKNTQPN